MTRCRPRRNASSQNGRRSSGRHWLGGRVGCRPETVARARFSVSWRKSRVAWMRRQGARLGGHALGLDDRSEPFRVMPVPARDEVPVEIHVICTESRLRHPMAPSVAPGQSPADPAAGSLLTDRAAHSDEHSRSRGAWPGCGRASAAQPDVRQSTRWPVGVSSTRLAAPPSPSYTTRPAGG